MLIFSVNFIIENSYMNFKTLNFTLVFVNCTWYIIACQLNIAAIGFNFLTLPVFYTGNFVNI